MAEGGQIPLSRPSLTELERELVTDTLMSGRLSLGPRLEEFERRFADFVGAPFAAAVSSGTAGLHLAVRAAGMGMGDEVITTPFSFAASANCILYAGATPVFVDIDGDTLNIDPALVEAALTEKTTAILPVHIFGYPADMAAIEEIAGRRELAVIEDACEALGTVCGDGVKVGARGNLAVFGFYPNKQITTGEGGMVTCADRDSYRRIVSERNQGRSPDMDWLDHERLGFNYRLDELSCALGIAQLGRLDDLLALRSRAAGWYGERLEGVDSLTLPCADNGSERRSWFVYVVQLPEDVDRDRLVGDLGEQGIATKPYLPAIHLQPYMRERFGFRPGEFPVCEAVAGRSLALPFFSDIQESQVDRVCEALRNLLSAG